MPFSRLSKIHNSLENLGPNFFKRFPKTAYAVSINKFKRNLDKMLKNRAFYSIQESQECNLPDFSF